MSKDGTITAATGTATTHSLKKDHPLLKSTSPTPINPLIAASLPAIVGATTSVTALLTTSMDPITSVQPTALLSQALEALQEITLLHQADHLMDQVSATLD